MIAGETPGLSERHAEIRSERISRAVRTVIWTIAIALLLFASFAIGTALGPAPLSPLEILIGIGLAIALGAVWAIPVARRRLETGARSKIVLGEGRGKVRMVAFDDYFTLGPEIVLRVSVTSVEVEPRALVLRYRDPRYEGVVLRELTGDPAVVSEAERVLKGAGPG